MSRIPRGSFDSTGRDDASRTRWRSRRQFLRCGGLAVAFGLAGCTDGTGDGTTTPTGAGTTTTTGNGTTTTTGNGATTASETTDPDTTDPATTPPGGSLVESARLVPDDGDEGDEFGSAVAVTDDVAVVGAPHDEDPHGADAGSAYVFERSGGGWSQRAKLTAPDGDTEDRFGAAVAVAGNTAVVGAPRDEDPGGTDAGSAYVFERSGGGWSGGTKLVAGDGDSKDRFGSAVAVTGDAAFVGAPRDEGGGDPFVGAVYAFERSGGGWSRVGKLAAGDGDAADQFGSAVAADGDTLVVGAETDDDPNGSDAGSAYVFERSGGGWSQRAKLTAPDGDTGDTFGSSVGVGGDTALAGMPRHDASGKRWAGGAAAFERTGDEWSRRTKLTADDGERGDRFGSAVAVAGGTLLVGSRTDENANGPGAGAVYAFEWDGGSWTRAGKLVPGEGTANDEFGGAVALSGSGRTALVGAGSDGDPNGRKAGTAYVFER